MTNTKGIRASVKIKASKQAVASDDLCEDLHTLSVYHTYSHLRGYNADKDPYSYHQQKVLNTAPPRSLCKWSLDVMSSWYGHM